MNGATAAKLETITETPAPRVRGKRLEREWRTIAIMIADYCRDHAHCAQGLCAQCDGLRAYAAQRLERCRFGASKPTCARCPVHCYSPVLREQIKTVMRHSGPRMLWRHPLLALWHWVDGLRVLKG